MKIKKILTISLLACMMISMAACSKGNNSSNNASANNMTSQNENLDKKIEETTKKLQAISDEENKIYDSHKELWDKLWLQADKSQATTNKNMEYSEFLTDLIEKNSDSFTEDELKSLKDDVEKIKVLDKDVEKLNGEMEELQAKKMTSTNSKSGNTSENTFPEFTGKDFDGNDVDQSIFSKNKFTVVNFWFNDCAPCVAELTDLDKLNEEIKAKGGAVIGVNAVASDGNKEKIEEAKEILESKKAKYQNIYFNSNTKGGDFLGTITGFPTTIVVNSKGEIIGNPLLGGIDKEKNLAKLKETIEEAIKSNN